MTFLSHLTIRTRLLAAVLVPVLITAGTLAWITASQIQENAEEELKRLEASLLQARKAGLRSLIDAAKAVVLEAKNDPSLSEDQAKEAAAARLRSIRFDETNYVFAYTRNVYNLAYAPDPSKEGPTSNPTLKRLVGDLFDAAESNGFYGYEWINPASGNEEPKLSYSTVIPDWDWMIGAGVYITDIERELAAARQEMDRGMSATLGFILLVTAMVVVIALVIGIFVGRSVTTPPMVKVIFASVCRMRAKMSWPSWADGSMPLWSRSRTPCGKWALPPIRWPRPRKS